MSEPPYPAYPPQQRRPQPPGYAPRPHLPQPSRAPQPPPRRLDPETAGQVRAAYATRRELGPEYEDAIAAGLAERVEELVAHRTAELRHADALAKEEREDFRRARSQSFVLGIISLGCGIPITAISGSYAQLPGILAAWAGIVGVNGIVGWSNRRRTRG